MLRSSKRGRASLRRAKTTAGLALTLALGALPAAAQGAAEGAFSQANEPVRVDSTERGLVRVEATDADLGEVLRALTGAVGMDLVLDADVQGRVTLRLRDVPFRDALEAVLETQDLAAEREGRILLVAPRARLVERAEARAAARERYERTLPMEVRVVPIDFADPAVLIPLIEEVLSERGSVRYDARTRSLIIRDVEGSAAFGL